jgi:peptidoglycan/LPS O-acetylase OafA/YrhL
MGCYRLFLAMLVAITHTGVNVYGYNLGAIAVVSFYILSGYVMSLLIEKYYKDPANISGFYLDRFFRIFPQFCFYMILSSICIYGLGIISPAHSRLTPIKWLMNFLILPQGFYMVFTEEAIVIPQTWSLGLEVTFYLVMPWILIYLSRWQIYGLAGGSFLVFLAAYFNQINSDYFGYRLLPGTLFIFLIGWSFAQNDRNSKRFRVIVFLLAGILFLIAHANQYIYQLLFNKEVLVGVMSGILVVNFMRRLNASKWDVFLGNLSYGIFLNHFIVIWLMRKFFRVTTFSPANFAVLLLSSAVLAYFSFCYIERPALIWRHGIRDKQLRQRRLAPAPAGEEVQR